jgi:hypothetical protein
VLDSILEPVAGVELLKEVFTSRARFVPVSYVRLNRNIQDIIDYKDYGSIQCLFQLAM